MKVGDRIRLNGGNVVVCVDRWQRNQTVGWWVEPDYSAVMVKDTIQDIESMWDIGNKTFHPFHPYCLSLCLLSEVDETENEFGVISP